MLFVILMFLLVVTGIVIVVCVVVISRSAGVLGESVMEWEENLLFSCCFVICAKE